MIFPSYKTILQLLDGSRLTVTITGDYRPAETCRDLQQKTFGILFPVPKLGKAKATEISNYSKNKRIN
jgi:hypothetical protein